MIFSKQERLLRTSKRAVIAAHIYLQERNVGWFTDALLQEILQAIRPRLHDKIAECREGTRAASVFTNRAFQVAYYVDKAAHSSQVLLQEPIVKQDDSPARDKPDAVVDGGQFAYTALQPTKYVLVMVPEPFDANNSVALPKALAVEAE
ncbi:hypothetical protein GGF46_002705 [Coemansia sp. RSA 552]|nr:hypothetical protein GGF46_002705 [Coemansia sp. RSA 552]